MRYLPITIGTTIKTNIIIDNKGKIVGYIDNKKGENK